MSRRFEGGVDFRANARSLEEDDHRKHECGHHEHEPFHIVVFEPAGEMQNDDGNSNEIKHGKQDIGQRVVPLSIGAFAVIVLSARRAGTLPARPQTLARGFRMQRN